MPKETFLLGGLVKKLDIDKGKLFGDFNLNRWFKETAKRYGILFYDSCCPEASEAGYSPIRWNNTSGQIEHMTGGVWTNTAATPAPTSAVLDDTANTFNFTYATGITSNAEYEQTLNGGTTWTALSAKPITGLTGAHAINTVGVRVKASGARPASQPLYNTVAFT